MKVVVTVARILLGLEFILFGLNVFLQFLHMPMPTGLAGQFLGVLVASHFMHFVALLQIVGGVLLISGNFLPLALTILGPILVSILLYHALMAPAGLPLAAITAILWLLVFIYVRGAFTGIVARQVQV
ncbi:MAG TPA: hypothetical protein VG168_04845 [Bryobacteraceae bacterium]|nr:hypothetical protein [Bryobacteraceae bacterium]